jgi:hypothetical protein
MKPGDACVVELGYQLIAWIIDHIIPLVCHDRDHPEQPYLSSEFLSKPSVWPRGPVVEWIVSACVTLQVKVLI